MRRQYSAIQEAHGEVVVISFEPKARLAQLSRQMQLPFRLLSDPERDVYRAYGLTRGSWLQAFSPGTILSYIKLLGRGRRYHFHRSDLRQMGGDFVLDTAGVVRFEYRSAFPSDRPAVEQLVGVLEGTN